jgi:hypothetical protein
MDTGGGVDMELLLSLAKKDGEAAAAKQKAAELADALRQTQAVSPSDCGRRCQRRVGATGCFT